MAAWRTKAKRRRPQLKTQRSWSCGTHPAGDDTSRHCATVPPVGLHETMRMSIAAPSSADLQLVFQCVDGTAILFPNELQQAALRGAKVELQVGIGRDRFMEIDAEGRLILVAAAESVDDLARMTLP